MSELSAMTISRAARRNAAVRIYPSISIFRLNRALVPYQAMATARIHTAPEPGIGGNTACDLPGHQRKTRPEESDDGQLIFGIDYTLVELLYVVSLRLKVGALTSTWQVGVPPAEAQGGWMLHMAFSYKAKILHTSARFPIP